MVDSLFGPVDCRKFSCSSSPAALISNTELPFGEIKVADGLREGSFKTLGVSSCLLLVNVYLSLPVSSSSWCVGFSDELLLVEGDEYLFAGCVERVTCVGMSVVCEEFFADNWS